MNRIFLPLAVLLGTLCCEAQGLDPILKRGIKLHDEGKFEEAIATYDSAIAANPGSYLAYYEKSLSLMKSGKLQESIDLSDWALKKFPDGEENASFYVNNGTCWDLLKNPQKALEVYDEGIKKYPGTSLLYFNKAITLYNTGKLRETEAALEKSIHYNPYHASSHQVMAVLKSQSNRSYSLLAGLFFMVIEPTGKRAEGRLQLIEAAIGANVEKKDDKNVTINLSMPDKKDKQPNDFSMMEMVMSMSVALDHSDKNKNETRPQRMQRVLDTVFAVLSEQEKGSGFGWAFYVPFFADLKNKGHL
ncbi:MAG: tetratricopeptide repeat protein, partial [Chitinophagaceae bacterium]|nr:tetratricopeptide repeat protein [Chitinophagaceae bacterium]